MFLQTAWISPTLIFSTGLSLWRGPKTLPLEFLTRYVLETSLRVDNVFVFVFLFTPFGIMLVSQHRVLFLRFLTLGSHPLKCWGENSPPRRRER